MKPIHFIGIGIVILVIVLYLSRNKIKAVMTRGYTNNNPGNIVKDGKTWIGEKPVSTDKVFKQFVSMPYGYRALFVNIKGYLAKNLNTLNKFLNAYAPPKENNTQAYIANVSKATGLSPDQPFYFSDTATIRKLVAAISQQENGIPPNMDDIDQGFKLLTV